MAETITVNSVDRSGVIPRKDVEWVESAYLGEVGQGRLVIHDDAGTISVPGFKPITVEQSSSTPSRIFTGFAGRKGIGRGTDVIYTSAAGREYELQTYDLNDLLHRFVIQGTGEDGGNRPIETIDDRLTWLLASDFLSTLVADFGAVTASSVEVDKADCRGKYPGDVIAELARAVKFNYYVRYKSGETLGELVFRDDNTSTDDTCTLSISNDKTEINSTTVFATQPAETVLTQDPEHVYSGAYAVHAKGRVYKHRAATALAFVERDGVTEDSAIRTDATALRDAATFLDESSTEEQLLPVTLRLRAAKVGLVQAGQRILTRQTHMGPEGWDPARYARILRKRVTQPLNTDNDYDVHLDLSPQETAPVSDICSDIYDPTPSGTYYPLGGVNTTPGAHPFASDGVVHYWRSGLAIPTVPGTFEIGSWHFGVWGAGGLGNTDWAGDCTGNVLILITSGNGEWTIPTEMYGGSPRAMDVFMGPEYSGAAHVAYINSGDSVVVTIADATDADCIRATAIQDRGLACGGKWGFSGTGAVWVAA